MSYEVKTLSGDVITVPKTHYDVDQGDVGYVVELDGKAVSHVLVANTYFGYIIKAKYPFELTKCGTNVVTERLDGEVRVFSPPRSR